MHTSCDALSSSSVDAVDAVNAYVDAFNDDAPDAPAKAGPAVDALNRSADQVAGSLSEPLSRRAAERAERLGGLRAAAGGGHRRRRRDLDEFNVAISQLNDVEDRALDLCDAAY